MLPPLNEESLIPCGLREITVKQPLSNGEKTDALPPDSLLLIPDSLIPDSLVVAQNKSEPKKRKTQIPADFEPNETGKRKAVDKGLSCVEELLKFIDYHSAKGSVMADWQAAWRTWVSNARPNPAIVKSSNPVSFKQTDDETGMRRWEEMTGRIHPDREKTHVIDMNPIQKEIAQ